MVCEVIVDIAHSEVDKIFDYLSDNPSATVGCRVVVPFGKTKIDGIIIGVKEKSELPTSKLKPIIRVIDEKPAVTEEHLELMEFMRAKYHIPAASVLRLFLPSEMRKGKVREKLVRFAVWNDSLTQDDAIKKLSPRAKSQIEACKFICDEKKFKIAELNSNFGNSCIRALLDKGIITVDDERVNRSPYTSLSESGSFLELTRDQQKAVDGFFATDKTVTLIHGVTGSGKTAVYLHLIKRVVESGKSAIFLVPEISLTPQMLAQLRACFKDNCAILHSGLSAGEKFDEWWRLRSGEAKIAIGARSAVFAPLENLGLIIIDEEHDGSYESESAPRYSTIDIAEFRAKYNRCKLVLGSATPSVETYLKAQNGEYNLAEMPERINKKPLPEVVIADMREEIKRGNNSAFSTALKDELQKCLNDGNQAIIFINRRGYAQQIVCRECGFVAKCENCDVTLNYHSDVNLLKCHYCGAAYKMPRACPECGGVHINYVGTGTQKVVEEIKKLFPTARILRMDNDTTQKKESHFQILKQMAEKKADILVGTQMIAKGHDFPSVTLVGILDADMSLFFSDFRSAERTFQLLTQVAGRCGRADRAGTVVLQTYAPNSSVLRFAAAYDYKGFFARECALRKSTEYPPFATILRVMVESSVDADALNTLRKVYEKIKPIYETNRNKFIFFKHMKSPINRLKNKFRYQILMRLRLNSDDIIDKIYEEALKFSTSKILVYVEKNPSSLS